MSLDDGIISFAICIRDLKATDLTTRHRFKEKLKLNLEFDEKRFKTRKELVGGGDVSWKYNNKFEWQLRQPHTPQSTIYDTVKKDLESKQFKVTVTCQHDRKRNPLGTVTLDLYTACTGPVEHNLPIKTTEGVTVGRLSFALEMSQLSNVAVIFKYIKVRNLKSMEKQVQGVNPYLKYGYSKYWPAIQERKLKAFYSTVQHQNANPEWRDLPWMRFKATLNELVRESIVVHITHRGRSQNIPIGRVNLLFRTLVDNGKSFKEEDTISFKGPLKVDNAEIEGTLNFKFLPRFAQMVPITVIRKAIHTEKGIFDAMPLLPWLPKPNNIPILRSSEIETSLDTNSPLLTKKSGGRSRAKSLSFQRGMSKSSLEKTKDKAKSSSSNKDKDKEKEKDKKAASKPQDKKEQEENDDDYSSDSDSDSSSESESESTTSSNNKNGHKDSFRSTISSEDLIDLSSPAIKRDRAYTTVDGHHQFSFPLSLSANTLPNGAHTSFFGTQSLVGQPMVLSLATPSLSSSSDSNNNNNNNNNTGESPTPSESGYSPTSTDQPTFNPFCGQQSAPVANPFGGQQATSNPFAVM